MLSQLWQPSTWPLSLDELDAQKPDIPDVPGGVQFIGEQTRRQGGALRTTWTFEGVNGDGKSVTFKGRSNSPDYSFEPGFSQASLLEHPNWQTLKQTWNGQSLDNQAVFPEFTGGGSSTNGAVKGTDSNNQQNPLFGKKDFMRMEGTYSYRYAATVYAVPQRAIGKIAASIPGQPPTFSNRNWLFASAPFQRRGPVLEITEVYWLSGEGGWPKPIYSDDATGS